MKKSILFAIISISFFACTKETIQPSAIGSNATGESLRSSQPRVEFKVSDPFTIYLSQGLNTLQSDSFYIENDTSFISSFLYVISGHPNLSNFKFYLNGGQLNATITYFNDTIVVSARRKLKLAPGNYNYILQAKTTGNSGTEFSTALNSAIIVDRQGFMAEILNLPSVGNSMIIR